MLLLSCVASFRRWPQWVAVAMAAIVSGCASTKNPERLFPVPEEMALIREAQGNLASQYASAFSSRALDQARAVRNEIIAQRMYAIDVQYTQYETALTREMQEGGFAALTTAEGLGTAATLLTPVVTKSILSALTTAVVATKGHYNSEVLLALTMRTIQKQMRASRNKIAAQISARMNQSVTDYPLAAAMSDVEDYYLAGTLTTGVIDTSTTVGIEEKRTQLVKQDVSQAPLSARPSVLLRETNVPLVAPQRFPIRFAGRGEAESRLSVARTKELEYVVCLAEDGVFTANLRDKVIEHLGPRKDASYPGQITPPDLDYMREDFRKMKRKQMSRQCP